MTLQEMNDAQTKILKAKRLLEEIEVVERILESANDGKTLILMAITSEFSGQTNPLHISFKDEPLHDDIRELLRKYFDILTYRFDSL